MGLAALSSIAGEPSREARLRALSSRMMAITQWRRVNIQNLEQEEKEVAAAKFRANLKDDVQDVMTDLQRRANGRVVGAFEDLLTHLVQEVLPDPGKRIAMSVDSVRNLPSLRVQVAVTDKITAEREFESVIDGNGGSMTNVVCAGLRLIALRKSMGSLRQFMIVDEGDCWLAPERVPGFYNVLFEAAAKLHIQLLVITHHDLDLVSQSGAWIVELKKDGDDLIAVGSGGNPAWGQDDLGLRSIRLVNYRSHRDTVIQLSPGITILRGENNIGKSAVVDAIRSLSDGTARDEVIRHGCDVATVEIEVEQGTLSWSRFLNKSPKEMYRLIGHDGDEIHSGSPGKSGVPEWVLDKECLGLRRMDDMDIQIGHQKSPVFMLDQPETKQASILSVGQESGYVQKMFVAHKQMLREDAERIKLGEARITLIKHGLVATEFVEPFRLLLDDCANDLSVIEKDMAADARLSEIAAKMADFSSLLSGWRKEDDIRPPVTGAQLRLPTEIARIISGMAAAKTISAIKMAEGHLEGARLSDTKEIIVIGKSLRASEWTKEGLLPRCDIPVAPKIASDHGRAGAMIDGLGKMSVLLGMPPMDGIPTPPENLNETTFITLKALQDANHLGVQLKAESRQVDLEVEANNEEWGRAVEAAGGVCPLCNGPINSVEHKKAGHA